MCLLRAFAGCRRHLRCSRSAPHVPEVQHRGSGVPRARHGNVRRIGCDLIRPARQLTTDAGRASVLSVVSPDRSTAVSASPALAPRCGRGVRARLRPIAADIADDARRRPVALAQPLERPTSAPPGVSARPVVRRRQPTVTGLPGAHRLEHALARPPRLNRARVASLAVRVRIALAVARLRVSATAAAHALVAGFDRPGLLAGRVVEVRLDRRRRGPSIRSVISDSTGLPLPARRGRRMSLGR